MAKRKTKAKRAKTKKRAKAVKKKKRTIAKPRKKKVVKKVAKNKVRKVSRKVKNPTKKRAIVKTSRLKKKRNRHVYSVKLHGPKLADIENEIADIPLITDMDYEFGQSVKIVLFSREPGSSHPEAISHIYTVDDPFEINLSALDLLYDAFYVPKRALSKSESEVRAGVPEGIQIDFESAGNQYRRPTKKTKKRRKK